MAAGQPAKIRNERANRDFGSSHCYWANWASKSLPLPILPTARAREHGVYGIDASYQFARAEKTNIPSAWAGGEWKGQNNREVQYFLSPRGSGLNGSSMGAHGQPWARTVREWRIRIQSGSGMFRGRVSVCRAWFMIARASAEPGPSVEVNSEQPECFLSRQGWQHCPRIRPAQ